MPKRTDISSILIVGAGPIIIGQACEFDYSGTQAVKALKEEGYRIVLVNSNPATIMTDPDLADATYVEPITPEIVAKIIEKERPDAILPTMGGQTALNCALSLKKMGVLEKFNVEMIGATAEAIDKAEDRQLFREAMTKIGLDTPKSRLANASALKKADRDAYLAELARLEALDMHPGDKKRVISSYKLKWDAGENDRRKRYQEHAMGEALIALSEVGLPAIIRPSFTMGGTGGGIAYNREEFLDIVERRLGRLSHQRGADRGERARLEGVRDGGRPRQGGQLHHHLLHRELRPDGRAYRRFHHRGACPDADRQGIPDHARRLAGGAA